MLVAASYWAFGTAWSPPRRTSATYAAMTRTIAICAQQLVYGHSLRHEQREHHGRHEQKGDQWNASHELDVRDAHAFDGRQLRSSPERERDGERKRGSESDR